MKIEEAREKLKEVLKDKAMTSRELSIVLNLDILRTRQILRKLVVEGFLIKRKKGKINYYSLFFVRS